MASPADTRVVRTLAATAAATSQVDWAAIYLRKRPKQIAMDGLTSGSDGGARVRGGGGGGDNVRSGVTINQRLIKLSSNRKLGNSIFATLKSTHFQYKKSAFFIQRIMTLLAAFFVARARAPEKYQLQTHVAD